MTKVTPLWRALSGVSLLCVLLLLHWQTYGSMVSTWLTNSTYTHGFAIPLISVFFAWQLRESAEQVDSASWWPGLLVLLAISAVWTVATIINVQVVAQLASVGAISALVLSIAGPSQARVFLLPLGYLLFAVPFGEVAVPYLMEWTATFTVWALNVTGIPVVREGLFFSTSAGNFEVAKACSGVRYLLASAAAGVAFAFLTYNGWKKRMWFILASLLVPIIANGIRAYAIVLIAHYSEMSLATGIDHFIYGWFFFAIIIFAMFFVGSRFADSHVTTETLVPAEPAFTNPPRSNHPGRFIAISVLAVMLIAAGPAFVQYRTHIANTPMPSLADATEVDRGWSGPLPAVSGWDLDFIGVQRSLSGSYKLDTARVEVRVASYVSQTQGAELVNSENRIADEDDFRIVRLGSMDVAVGGVQRVRVARIQSREQDYLVWYWYQQGTELTISSYRAKWLELLAVLRPAPAAVVAIAVADTDEHGSTILSNFLTEVGIQLRNCVAGTKANATCTNPDVTTATVGRR